MKERSDAGMKVPSPERAGVVDCLLLGTTAGLALGLAEVAVLAFRKWGLGHYLHLNPQVAWLAPLFYAISFGGLAGFVWLVGRRMGDRHLVRAITFLTFGLGASGVFFAIRGMHRLAGLLLGIGLAVQVSGMVARRWLALRPRLRSATATLAIVAALVGAAVNRPAFVGTLRSPATAAPQTQNILWIIWDTVRASSLSVYGYDRPTTPTLERLAAAGVVFEHAIAPSPWTLPSHASMFTGLPPHRLDADWHTPLGKDPLTVAEVARARGYRTGGFVANLFYASRESGLARGFATYVDHPVFTVPELLRSTALARTAFEARSSPAVRAILRWVSRGHAAPGRRTTPPAADSAPDRDPRAAGGIIARLRDEGRIWAPRINDEFLGWASAEDGRPFFAFLNYFDAHDPYRPPVPFDTAFGRDPRRATPALSEGRRYTPDEVEALTVAYDASIAYLDHQLETLLRRMADLGLLENTVIIVTSDHGEEFGEHDVFTHGHSLYQPALRVPLVLAGPGIPAGVRVPNWVTTTDIAATIQSIAGIEEGVPGTSLDRHWQALARRPNMVDTLNARVSFSWAVPDFYPISDGPMEAVFADPYKYIRNGDGREELYDLRKDPGELDDLSRSNGAAEIFYRLRPHVPDTRGGSIDR